MRDLVLRAVFEPNPFTVLVELAGHGAVHQRWQPADGPDTTVELSAAPEAGWRFAGWTGDAAGVANPIHVDLSGPFTVLATFVPAGSADSSAGGARPLEPVAAEFALAPVRPNPALSRARLEFSLPVASAVTLEILDLQGREVARPVDGVLPAGRHEAEWDGRRADGTGTSGVFFVRLRSPQGVLTRRFVLVR